MAYRIYGFDDCPWCGKAKDLLDRYGIPYEAVDLPTREERVAWMDGRRFEGQDRTFPKVYVSLGDGTERLVGGYGDLEVEILFDDCA